MARAAAVPRHGRDRWTPRPRHRRSGVQSRSQRHRLRTPREARAEARVRPSRRRQATAAEVGRLPAHVRERRGSVPRGRVDGRHPRPSRAWRASGSASVSVFVHELDLPEASFEDLDRDEALALYAELRERHWLARTPVGYLVMRHDDVTALLRDRRFHSALSMITQTAGLSEEQESSFMEGRQDSILMLEGAEHTRLRKIVAPAFTPRSSDRFRPFMRDTVNGLIDPVAASGTCDLVVDICEPYPIQVICEVLGAPQEDWKLFSNRATDIFRVFNNDLANDLPLIDAANA